MFGVRIKFSLHFEKFIEKWLNARTDDKGWGPSGDRWKLKEYRQPFRMDCEYNVLVAMV